MREIYLFFIFYAFVAIRPGLTQSAFPFPKDSAEWVIKEVSPILGPTDYFTYYRYLVKGENVEFKNKTYVKFYYQKLCWCNCYPGTYTSFNLPAYVIGGIRNENGKVYFTTFGGNGSSYFNPVIDTLLFDFTAKVGDTLSYKTDKLVFTKIDTFSDGSRRLWFDAYSGNNEFGSPAKAAWTEGVGAYHPFYSYKFYGAPYISDACFSNTIPSSCPIPCSITPVESPETGKDIFFSPNISDEWIQFTAPDINAEYLLEIHDEIGRLISTQKGVRPGDQIYIGNVPAGILNIIIYSDEKAVGTTRVMKI